MARSPRACSPGEYRAAASQGSDLSRSGSADGAEDGRRPAGKVRTVGTFLAVADTLCAGRFNSSDTSATITGVAAALSSVPGPQRRDTANDAVADATLAIASVCGEMPLPARYSFRADVESSRREETDTPSKLPVRAPITLNGNLRLLRTTARCGDFRTPGADDRPRASCGLGTPALASSVSRLG